MTRFARAAALLRDAQAAGAFPAACIEAGSGGEVRWREAFGALTREAGAPPAAPDTIYDLASLTKVMATTTLVLRLVERGALDLDDRLTRWFADWRGADREHVTVRDLLEHASGLTAYLPFFHDHAGRRDFERTICTLPLEYPPRTQSIYSDLGFMLLGFLIEDAGGAPLPRQFEAVAAAVAPEPLAFAPPPAWRARTAPTEVDRWRGRLLAGEVHDENAWALGGAAGHSGLFGTAAAVGRFARTLLRPPAEEAAQLLRPDTIARMRQRSDVPGSSRALGWDAMRPTSSCGTRMSPDAIGHTGFTGTSLWIDFARDVYVVLLSNRVHPTRDDDRMLAVRPLVHDAVMEAL